MIVTFYENYKGGTNNLYVVQDSRTGEFATSLRGKISAIKNFQRRVKRGNQFDRQRI